MGIKDTAKGVGSKLRLDSHHMIERFGVMMLALTLTFALMMVAGVNFSISKNRKQLGSQAIYTSEFVTSKTDIPGTVEGVFTSNDRTRTMVLLKFEDVVSVAADAKDYQSFLTASSLDMKPEVPKGSPSGSIYVFGTTGYMGVYLVNAGGFQSQILNLTMRAKSELITPTTQQDTSDEVGDASFAKHDQWRVWFNPGASKAKKISSLDQSSPDARDMFYEMVTAPQEEAVHKELDGALKQMQVSLADIEEKTNRLNTTTVGDTGVRVIAPGAMKPSRVPKEIAGDKVTGKGAVGKDPSTLELVSDTTLPGGYDFDWRSGSVREGYLDELTPAGTDYVSFISQKSSEQSKNIDVSADTLDWTLSDGQKLINVDLNNPAYKPVNDNVLNLTKAYSTYFKGKQTYQSDVLPKLLDLEISLRSVASNTTVNTEKNVMLVY